jgi:hypothetical protein
MISSDVSTRNLELERFQRWMQAVITHPFGVNSGVASLEAQQSIDVDFETLETIVAPSSKLSGVERMSIYYRSYHARLLQCFHETFPALLRALGEELFNRFAFDYLRQHPPRSYTLDHLADAFPQHLADTRPNADAPPDERECWPDFIVDLARLEWAFLKVYDGPGVEGRATILRARDILSIDLERIPETRLAPAPCLRLFAFRYPVHAYMLAVRRDERAEIPAPLESFVAVTRRNYRVGMYELSAPQYAFLKALHKHQTIGQALNQSAQQRASWPPPTTNTVRNWLCDWTAKGFFESVEVSNDGRD